MSDSFRASSPIKKGTPPVEARRASDACRDLRKQNLPEDVDGAKFLHDYLSGYSLNPPEWPTEEQRLVTDIQEAGKEKKDEMSLYTGDAPLLRLLNSISKQAFEGTSGSEEEALVFHTAHEQYIKNPVTQLDRSPDVVALWEPPQVFETIDYSNDRLPAGMTWCSFGTIGEVKIKEQGQYQLASYLQHHLQFHPELNAVLGFTARPRDYALFYHDAAVIHRAKFDWKQPGPLYAFVQKLYTRPFRDTSMEMLDSESPKWATTIRDEIYVSTTPQAVIGPGQRRYTTAAINVTNNKKVFIKDIWRDERRFFFEASLLAQAHKVEPLLGLMSVHSHGYVPDANGTPIQTALQPGSAEGQGSRRYKMRMITEDVGRPLEEVRSVRQFLCVMYDACAVQRNLYRKCKILHRDISDGNIMLAPDTDEYRKRRAKGYAEVRFVNQVLAKKKECEPEPACLVIDLGNGADLNVPRTSNTLIERSGTRKFIARSVSSGELLAEEDFSSKDVTMPQMEGPLGDYCQFMDSAEDRESNSSVSATKSEAKFAHRLFHDAESTFWVIAWTLARSAGEGYQQETETDPIFNRFYHMMFNHFAVPGDEDPRSNCKKALSYWQSILHPDFASLASMLNKMFVYIQPEWAFRPELNPEHVHEALMRLLLVEIVRLGENDADISLAIGIRRMPDLPPAARTNMASRSGNNSMSFSQPSRSLGAQHHKTTKAKSRKTGPTEKPTNTRLDEPQTFIESQALHHPGPAPGAVAEGASDKTVDRDQLKTRVESLKLQGRTCELQPPKSETPGEKVENHASAT